MCKDLIKWCGLIEKEITYNEAKDKLFVLNMVTPNLKNTTKILNGATVVIGQVNDC